MKKFAAFIVLACALTACGGGGSSTSEESFVSGDGSTTYIKISDRKIAPAITGMTLSGENYTYQKDRVAVVNVWASWCSPCRAEAPTLVALANKYTDVAFIGILTRDIRLTLKLLNVDSRFHTQRLLMTQFCLVLKDLYPLTQFLQQLSWINQGSLLHEFRALLQSHHFPN